MWNVFLIEDGECTKLNSEPYDTEQIAELFDQLDEVEAATVLLTPARAPQLCTTPFSSQVFPETSTSFA